MTRKFQRDEKAIYIGLFSTVAAAIEVRTGPIQFVVRKVTIYTATAKFINIMDAETEEEIGRVLPQKVCETPADTERESYKFGVFAHMPIKDALEMAEDLGRHWQALNIDILVVQAESVRCQAAAQKHAMFRESREKSHAKLQEQLEYFRLRDVEAISYQQPDKAKRKMAYR